MKRRQRRNPTATTWILLAGGAAAVTGVGLGIWAWRKRKAEQEMLPPPGPTNGGGARPGGGGGARPGACESAPPHMGTAEARNLEALWVGQLIAEDATSGGLQGTANSKADRAFREMYGFSKIPPRNQRCSEGEWQPYVSSWNRLHQEFKDAGYP